MNHCGNKCGNFKLYCYLIPHWSKSIYHNSSNWFVHMWPLVQIASELMSAYSPLIRNFDCERQYGKQMCILMLQGPTLYRQWFFAPRKTFLLHTLAISDSICLFPRMFFSVSFLPNDLLRKRSYTMYISLHLHQFHHWLETDLHVSERPQIVWREPPI
jgi:hypothetical protein